MDSYSKYLDLMIQSGGVKKMKRKQKRLYGNTLNNNKMTHKLHLSEPWFTLISLGLKTVEGRKNKGLFKELKIGDVIEWYNDDFMPRTIKTIVTGKNTYKTFREYLETEGLQNCLPAMPSIEHGLSVYFKYYTEEDEKQYGVVAIQLKLYN